MKKLLLTGATGVMGSAIAGHLRPSYEIFCLQKGVHDPLDWKHWVDADLSDPVTSLNAVKQLMTEFGDETQLSGIVHAAGSDKYVDWKTMTTYALMREIQIHVAEPLMLTKVMIDFELMAPDAKIVFLLDERIQESSAWAASSIAKACIHGAAEAFSRYVPIGNRVCFVSAPDASRLGVTACVAKYVGKLLEGDFETGKVLKV